MCVIDLNEVQDALNVIITNTPSKRKIIQPKSQRSKVANRSVLKDKNVPPDNITPAITPSHSPDKPKSIELEKIKKYSKSGIKTSIDC